METLKHALFEDPSNLIAACVVAEIVLFLVWRSRRSRKLALSLLIAPVLAGVFFLTAKLVVTDREQINTICDDISLSVSEQNVRSVSKYVDGDFSGPYLSTERALQMAERALKSLEINSMAGNIQKLDISDGQASMEIRTSFFSQLFGRSIIVDWDVDWVKRNDSWKISKLSNYRLYKPGQ